MKMLRCAFFCPLIHAFDLEFQFRSYDQKKGQKLKK
jgi:hypothetical protein